jgi:hypothetical protein
MLFKMELAPSFFLLLAPYFAAAELSVEVGKVKCKGPINLKINAECDGGCAWGKHAMVFGNGTL